MNEDCFFIENEYSSLKNHILFHQIHHDIIPASFSSFNLLKEFYNTDIRTFDFAKPSPDDIALSSANKSFTHVSSKKETKKSPKKGPIIIAQKVPNAKKAKSVIDTKQNKKADETPRIEDIDAQTTPKKIIQMNNDKRKTILNKLQKDNKNHFHISFIGEFESGKSTILGHLLYLNDLVDSKTIEKYKKDNQKLNIANYHFAFVLDELQAERNRHLSIDIGIRTLKNSKCLYHLYDTPGYSDFLDRTIACINNSSYAFLVIDISEYAKNQDGSNIFSTIVRTSGILSIIVVLNKMDLVNYDETIYRVVHEKVVSNLKKAGFKEDNITIIPCSGLHGDNIKRPSQNLKWYKGPTLINCIESLKLPKVFVEKPFLMSVDECYRDFQASNFIIKGKVHYGILSKGDNLLLMPHNQLCNVKSIRSDGDSIDYLSSGCNIDAVISGPEEVNIGDVLCDPENPITISNKFESQIVTFQLERELINGEYCNIHIHQSVQSARIIKIINILSKDSTIKCPRLLGSKKTAVVQIQTINPIGIDTFKNNSAFGRFLLTIENKVVGAGMITKIL